MEVPKNAWFIILENPKICHGWYGGCPILGNLHHGQNVQLDFNKTRNFSSKIKLIEILLLLQTLSCCFYNSLLLFVSANDRISQIPWPTIPIQSCQRIPICDGLLTIDSLTGTPVHHIKKCSLNRPNHGYHLRNHSHQIQINKSTPDKSQMNVAKPMP